MSTIIMDYWVPMADRHPEEEWTWRGIVDPSIFNSTAYRISSISELSVGTCHYLAGGDCTATTTLFASTVNAAGAETFTWTGYVVGGDRPYAEDGTMTTDTDGTRRLSDIGDNPDTNTISANGQGVKFNGVDQTITTDSIVLNPANGYTISATVNDESGFILGSATSYRPFIRVLFGRVIFSDGSQETTSYFDQTSTFVLTITVTSAGISFFSNGVFIETVVKNFIAITTFSMIGGSDSGSSFSNGAINNVTFLTQTLTVEQIAYQFNNPEKFLYRQDDVLKSDILTQTEINNVVAYLPMCENDEYVRDLANYSEGVINADVTSLDSATNGVGNTVSDDGISKFMFHCESATSTITSPSCTIAVDDTKLYNLKVTIEITMGVAYFSYLGVGSANITYNEILAVGIYEYDLVTKSRSGGNILVVFNGLTEYNFNATVTVEAKRVEAIYPITKYTTDSRTLATNLDKGLQTSALVRDSFGVPTGIPNGTNHREGQKFETAMSVVAPYTAVEYVRKDNVLTKHVLVNDGTTQTLFTNSEASKVGVAIVNPVVLKEFSLLDPTQAIDERVSFSYTTDIGAITSGQGTNTIDVATTDNKTVTLNMSCEATDTIDTSKKSTTVTQARSEYPELLVNGQFNTQAEFDAWTIEAGEQVWVYNSSNGSADRTATSSSEELFTTEVTLEVGATYEINAEVSAFTANPRYYWNGLTDFSGLLGDPSQFVADTAVQQIGTTNAGATITMESISLKKVAEA